MDIDNMPDSNVNAQTSNTPQWIKAIGTYCTSGNIIAKVGVLILFIGFIFLLKYAAHSFYFPIKLKLIASAIFAGIVLGLGWMLRTKKPVYAITLQGCGFGIFYVILFMSTQLYHMVPVSWSLALMITLSIIIACTALMENARALIALAQLGGFLAPLLSGFGYIYGYDSNNALFLFSYYAVLNAAIAWIAWHKSWRILNCIVFVFTFIFASTWYSFFCICFIILVILLVRFVLNG